MDVGCRENWYAYNISRNMASKCREICAPRIAKCVAPRSAPVPRFPLSPLPSPVSLPFIPCSVSPLLPPRRLPAPYSPPLLPSLACALTRCLLPTTQARRLVTENDQPLTTKQSTHAVLAQGAASPARPPCSTPQPCGLTEDGDSMTGRPTNTHV